VISIRRIVTNVVENPSKNEYSISFNTYFDAEFRKAGDLLCNTSTLSIVASTNKDSSISDPVSSTPRCQLIGSFAVEVGGSGSFDIASCCIFCPFFFHLSCKQRVTKHAERKFESELHQYVIEAERRYVTQLITPQKNPTPPTQEDSISNT
jgi:hypothetical protein